MDLKRFGQNIQTLRKYRALKSGELAAKVGVAKSVLSGWENGVNKIPIDRLLDLACALDCSIGELFYQVDHRYDVCRRQRVAELRAKPFEGERFEEFKDDEFADRPMDFLDYLIKSLTPEQRKAALRAVQIAIAPSIEEIDKFIRDQPGDRQGFWFQLTHDLGHYLYPRPLPTETGPEKTGPEIVKRLKTKLRDKTKKTDRNSGRLRKRPQNLNAERPSKSPRQSP
jgi:transcriptional regulator with XRE-family HTH domain